MCVRSGNAGVKKKRKKEREHMDMENSMVILEVVSGVGGGRRGHREDKW